MHVADKFLVVPAHEVHAQFSTVHCMHPQRVQFCDPPLLRVLSFGQHYCEPEFLQACRVCDAHVFSIQRRPGEAIFFDGTPHCVVNVRACVKVRALH